ncbi:MAG: hypothetical protein J1F35_06395 [Erysipelotrichales bacterium]|nr:hypothetical protein [Erysipelotrichales bacterium]
MKLNSKLTLIVDGNWLLMSRLSVIKNRFAIEKQLSDNLKQIMTQSIKLMLRKIPKIDNIIIVADGGSWRCDLEIPKFLEDQNITYKGNREQDESLNWDLIFGAYEEWRELAQEAGITTCREFGIEGDDWCWYLSRKLNNNGTNCIIWSMDKDLTQLVQTDKDGVFTVTWNKLYMTMEENNEDDMNFLFNFNFSNNETLLNSIKTKAKEVKTIKPIEIVIDKIIRGDAGDNIFPIIKRKSKTNPDKTFRVRVKDIKYDLDVFNENEIDNYLLNLLSSKLYKNSVDKPYQDIYEHFNYNKKLVMLHKSSYPKEILDIMDNIEIGPASTNISYIEEKLNAKVASGDKIDLFEEI